MVLKVKKSDIDLMFRNSRQNAPSEACGIMIGRKKGDEKVVEKVFVTKNVEKENPSVRYKIDPEDIMLAFKTAEEDGMEVVGIFHSHPHHEPYWSAVDEDESDYLVGFSFLIFSLKTNGYKCYRKVREGVAEEEEVIVE